MRALFRFKRRKPVREIEIPDELDAPAVNTELSAAATAAITGGAPAITAGALVEEFDPLTERARVQAKKGPDMTVNILRMWLQEKS